MYYACGVMMLVAGLFLFIMNFFNYRWLEQEDQEKKKHEEVQIGSAKELSAIEEATDAEHSIKLSQEQLTDSESKET